MNVGKYCFNKDPIDRFGVKHSQRGLEGGGFRLPKNLGEKLWTNREILFFGNDFQLK